MQYWHICCLSMDCINSYEPSNLQDLRPWSHVCGFSFNWLCWWSFRWCVRVAECTHYVHLIGFSLMRILRCDGWWNDLKQWSHLCRFSPLCANRWILRISAPVAEWSHIVQLFLFSSVWVNMKWRFIKLAWPNVLLHCCHTCGFSKEWVRKCILKEHYWQNNLLHLSHLKIQMAQDTYYHIDS